MPGPRVDTPTPFGEHISEGLDPQPDGLCCCPDIPPSPLAGGECPRCHRLHPDGIAPNIACAFGFDRARWEASRVVSRRRVRAV